MRKLAFIFLFLAILLAVTVCSASGDENWPWTPTPVAAAVESPEDSSVPGSGFRLPASLSVIEDEAFEGTAITEVELPETVTAIGERAFANISTLRSIRIPVLTGTIASTAFEGSGNLTIHAAPNSYARKYARAVGIPFVPYATFRAANQSAVNINISDHSNEDAAIDPSETQTPEKQWHRVEEIRGTGTLELIFNDIQGRGPPLRKC